MSRHKKANHKDDAANESASLGARLAPVAVVVVLVSIPAFMIFKSCTALPGNTKEEFSQQFSCPVESITSKDRPDVHAEDFEKPATPPAEIANDPARLTVWKKNQPEPWPVDFFELSGCGHHVLWGCRLPSRTSSNGVHAFCPYTRDL